MASGSLLNNGLFNKLLVNRLKANEVKAKEIDGLISENKFVTINGLFRIPSHLSSELHAYCKSLEDPEGMFKVQQQKGLEKMVVLDLDEPGTCMWVEIWESEDKYNLSGFQQTYWNQYSNPEDVVGELESDPDWLANEIAMNWMGLFKLIWDSVALEYDAAKNEAPLSPNGQFGVCSYGNILINMGNIHKLEGEFCAIMCDSEGCQVLVKDQNFDNSISRRATGQQPTYITELLKSTGTVKKVL